jgi:hypothetical protein
MSLIRIATVICRVVVSCYVGRALGGLGAFNHPLTYPLPLFGMYVLQLLDKSINHVSGWPHIIMARHVTHFKAGSN